MQLRQHVGHHVLHGPTCTWPPPQRLQGLLQLLPLRSNPEQQPCERHHLDLLATHLQSRVHGPTPSVQRFAPMQRPPSPGQTNLNRTTEPLQHQMPRKSPVEQAWPTHSIPKSEPVDLGVRCSVSTTLPQEHRLPCCLGAQPPGTRTTPLRRWWPAPSRPLPRPTQERLQLSTLACHRRLFCPTPKLQPAELAKASCWKAAR
mmetsp:Transcript_39100/g.125730  ORF Transcript_39100/g.125730 Transcript_39100/m.125730 type:complete len:202 (+) Transcript_39100:946-1551(+)